MALVRTILAALIAISVALSPAIGEGVMLPSPGEVTNQADMPCCQCCDTQDHSKPTACVLKCITLSVAILPAQSVARPSLVDGRPMPLVQDTSDGVARKPPTRPPPA